jgi:uncharacterized protein (TIGR04551 family)
VKRWLGLSLGLAAVLAAAPARATGFSDYGRELGAEPERVLRLDGYFRLRADALYNFDLDRGPTPSGQLFYPVPVGDPKGQTLTRADMRFRTDLGLYAPGGMVAVKARLDMLDNVALGSAPEGIPSASGSQRADGQTITLKRVWGEALTPLGLFAVGRMGSHWGLGMLTNGGDCLDCDSGDAADRIAFVTPLLGHLWAVSYDFSATGPFVPDRSGTRSIGIAPSASVHTVTFAVMNTRTAAARRRRARAHKDTFEYGAYATHRWQNDDVPATYVPVAQPVPVDDQQVMARGYTANGLDLWTRLAGRSYRVELEAAYLTAKVEQPSLIPGVLLRDPATSKQLGAAFESEAGDGEDQFRLGLDMGYASGDSAPGFGAFPGVNQEAPVPGDLDGAQARPPYDTTVNNFRFHPDYRIDRILFREIIGTVTDAMYLKPHARVDVFRFPSGRLQASLAAVMSWAVNAESAPGGRAPLGVELDPTLRYESRDGFVLALEQATLFPLAGLDNRELDMKAKPAQLWRAFVAYLF